MSERREITGVWALADNIEATAAGTLVINFDEGCVLKRLVGPLTAVLPQFGRIPGHLHSVSHTGSFITCRGCFVVGSQSDLAGNRQLDVEVEDVFEGQHFGSEAEFVFSSATFIYDHLNTWINTSAFKTSVSQAAGTLIEHVRGRLWSVSVDDGFEIENGYIFSTSDKSSPHQERSFSNRDGLFIKAKTPRTLDSFFLVEQKFRALIDVLADCQLNILELKLTGQNAPFPVRVFSRRFLQPHVGPKPEHFFQPISFPEIATSFPKMITVYFGASYFFEHASLYRLARHYQNLPIESSFITCMQALESFHRDLVGGRYMAPENYLTSVGSKLKGAIPSNLDSSFREKLKGMIKYGYEFSFRKRLGDLAAHFPRIKQLAIAANPEFIGKTVDTRNYLTHRDSELAANALTGCALFQCLEVWQMVLLAHYLKALGLDDPVISKAVQRTSARRVISP